MHKRESTVLFTVCFGIGISEIHETVSWSQNEKKTDKGRSENSSFRTYSKQFCVLV